MVTPRSFFIESLRLHSRQVMAATFFSVINKLFDILPEILIGIAVNVVTENQPVRLIFVGDISLKSALALLGVATLVISGLESFTQYWHTMLWSKLGQSLQNDMRLRLYRHIEYLSLYFFEDKSTGELASIATEEINQVEHFLDRGPNDFIHIVVSTIVIGGLFFYYVPYIALFVLLPVPIIIALSFYYQKLLAVQYSKVRKVANMLAAFITHTLTGIVTIKSYTTEEYEYNRLKEISGEYKYESNQAITISSTFIPLVRMVIVLGFVATLVIGGWKVLDGTLAIGTYSMLVFLTQRFLWPFKSLAELVDSYQSMMASLERVLHVLQTPTVAYAGSDVMVPTQSPSIRFEGIFFRYAHSANILNDLSLKIPAGSTVAFVGETGSGKSTILKLLMRFYDAQEGNIYINNSLIQEYKVEQLRQSIGLVSQDVFLTYGNIADNIRYGSFNAPFSEVVKAAQQAQAYEFIMNLPDGFDTFVGAQGQKLSGGQKQRIAIARALLKNPSIFIFDEATSALDNETERAIQNSLEIITQKTTTIIIAHRLSTVRKADIIFVLEKGKVDEAGTHADLLHKDKAYARLWSLQTDSA